MKMKSVSGVVCYVKDIKKTARFYEQLGFIFEKREADNVSVHLNWFWIDFHPQDKEDKPEFQKEAKYHCVPYASACGYSGCVKNSEGSPSVKLS